MSMVPRMYYQEPFYQQVWDPFPEFQFRGTVVAPRPAPAFSTETSFGLTNLEWKETPEAHVLKADLPGIKRNELKLEVLDGGILCISGEKKVEKEVKNEHWYRVEHSTGSFVRRFRLPDNAKAEELSAYLENGVLTVTIPKEQPKNYPTRTIQILGD